MAADPIILATPQHLGAAVEIDATVLGCRAVWDCASAEQVAATLELISTAAWPTGLVLTAKISQSGNPGSYAVFPTNSLTVSAVGTTEALKIGPVRFFALEVTTVGSSGTVIATVNGR